jgi:hypothetical protein
MAALKSEELKYDEQTVYLIELLLPIFGVWY